jgi:hypothetical protein
LANKAAPLASQKNLVISTTKDSNPALRPFFPGFSFSLLSPFCLLNISLFLIGGCAGTAKKTPVPNPTVDNQRVLDSVLAELQLRYDLTMTLYTQMKVTIKERGKREEIREILWYKRSETGEDQLHVQAMGIYNQPRAVMIAAKGEFLLYLINEQESVRVPLKDAILQEIFGVDLRISDVKSAIFANPFLDLVELSTEEDLSFDVSQIGAKLQIQYSITDQVEEISIFNFTDQPVVRSWRVIGLDGKLIQETKFSDYREVDGILRPYRIVIERPGDDTEVTIKTINPKIGAEISDHKFNLDLLPQ